MNKGQLMKLVYTEKELRNIDSGIPKELWEGIDTWSHVINYNDNGAFGKLENMLLKKTLKGESFVMFRDWQCITETAITEHNETSIRLVDIEGGSPVATCTVDLFHSHGILAPKKYVLIKEYGENEGMTDTLVKHNVIWEPIKSIEINKYGSKVNICKLR